MRRLYQMLAIGMALALWILGIAREPMAFAQAHGPDAGAVAPAIAEPPVAAPAAAPAPSPSSSASAPIAPAAAADDSAKGAPHGAPSVAVAAAAAASAAARAAASGEIRVHEKTVVTLRAPRAGHTAQDRARTATLAIEALLAQTNEEIGEARYEANDGAAVVFIGKTPILTLGPEDVAASGEASIDVLAAQVTTRLAQAVSTERKRSAIATTVFSVSLLVFSALIVFLIFNRVSEYAVRWRTSIDEHPGKVTALRLGKIEFVSAPAARGALTLGLTLGYRFLQIALAYGWLIFALSLFDATRGYTSRLTGTVVTPLYALATRIGGALPIVVVAGIAVVALSVLVRFVGLFFDSIIRGDTRVGWISRDLARPTSVLARFGIIIIALVLASPLITGEADGVISRVGLVALFAVALAATPLLASGVVGVTVVFGRRLKRGDDVEVGGRKGKVLDVTLLDVRIEDDALAEVSVPHLLGLVHPTRHVRHARLATLDVVVDPKVPQDSVEKALFEAARAQSSRGRVELVYLDAAGAHWRVTSASMRHDVSLAKVVQDALAKLGAGLGRGRDNVPAAPASSDDMAASSRRGGDARPEKT